MKYSLWLCPPESSPSFVLLDSLLSDVSKSLLTERFVPHATLFSPVLADNDEDAVDQVRKYAKTLAPGGIHVDIAALKTGSKYYQCILLEAINSDSLLAANNAAREYWNAQSQPLFNPHVSVAYGQLAGEELNNAETLVRSMLPNDLQQLSFVAKEIRIVMTVGPCSQWYIAGRVPID
ncbi:hypothetical protein H4S04_008315 [Coemansia sp. S16]|nr:hypothetical protein GGI14_003460 [Coemansia sp. S680]KAJ2036129.1 hypothetical protein GGI08_008668 [Coemansia sp. S2]KAJ2038598.1 hypothetical protein H4S04_008315 [Coemansia sp. S16]KAJ2059070.1 hypothetical protein GGH13_007011 [Coemansia sp. S155-1]KAJ2341530.1 hypothetical protein GGH92_005774 [Coemansia sp. RSA 2673]